MPRGGSRPGGGRPKGSLTRLTTQIANEALVDAAEKGTSPLEIILAAMNHFIEQQDFEKAAFYAEKAAPYMHPKLSAVAHTGPGGGPIPVITSSMSPAEAAELYQRTITGE